MNVTKFVSKKVVIILLIVALALSGVAVLHARSVHKAQKTSGSIPTSKKSVSSKSTKKSSQKSSGSSDSTSSTKYQGPSASSSAGLIAPFGTFISNHKPGQNGSPTTEQSVCNTTPGASCDIQFTNAGVIKSLGAQVADSNGTAYWSWDIKGGTLAPGSWGVTAVVKLNGQTKTATDPMPLEVK